MTKRDIKDDIERWNKIKSVDYNAFFAMMEDIYKEINELREEILEMKNEDF